MQEVGFNTRIETSKIYISDDYNFRIPLIMNKEYWTQFPFYILRICFSRAPSLKVQPSRNLASKTEQQLLATELTKLQWIYWQKTSLFSREDPQYTV